MGGGARTSARVSHGGAGVGWLRAASAEARSVRANICSPAAYLIVRSGASERSCSCGVPGGEGNPRSQSALAELEDAYNPREAEDTEDGGARAREPKELEIPW